MGEKNKNEGEKKNEDKKGDGGKKDDGKITVVLKVDLHCDGCAKKICRSIRRFEGVESVKEDFATNKITVVGKVDPMKLREWVEYKSNKKVELISPQPKKDKDGSGDKKAEEKPEKKTDEKKNKEPPVSTIVLKMGLHCDGCIKKIRRIISKTKGVQELTVDRQKDLVTVKGTMDTKVLIPLLKEKLNKNVEIITPKKDDGGGGEKKEKGGGGGEKKEKGGGGGGGGGGEKKEKGGDGGGGGEKKGGDGKTEESAQIENRLDYSFNPYGYGYGHGYEYGHGHGHVGQGYGHVGNVHAPQMFSDENPNACSIM